METDYEERKLMKKFVRQTHSENLGQKKKPTNLLYKCILMQRDSCSCCHQTEGTIARHSGSKMKLYSKDCYGMIRKC